MGGVLVCGGGVHPPSITQKKIWRWANATFDMQASEHLVWARAMGDKLIAGRLAWHLIWQSI